jgi:hypothetical protein
VTTSLSAGKFQGASPSDLTYGDLVWSLRQRICPDRAILLKEQARRMANRRHRLAVLMGRVSHQSR